MAEFQELRIRARAIGGGRHLVLASGAASGAAVIRAGGEPARLRAELHHLVDIRLHRVPQKGVNVADRLRALGREVFEVLFGSGLKDQLKEVLTETHSLRLRFDLPPELAELPVETLCTPPHWPGQSLALDTNRSLVRTVPGIASRQRFPAPGDDPEQIRILIATASPGGLDPIDADAEIGIARTRWSWVTTQTEICRGATREHIKQWVGRQQGPAAVLLIAHGDWDVDRGDGVVYLQTEDGAIDPVDSQLLSGILVGAEKLRLVMLNLCHGADSRGDEMFAGLAQALISRGVPAVVGMNGLVSDATARKIGPMLLERISHNETLDEAVTTARQLLPPDSIEWATLHLFCNEQFGHPWLFKAPQVEDDTEVPDPLREGQRALDEVRRPKGNIRVETLLRAAKYLRSTQQWQPLQNVASRHANAELRRLSSEADFEIAWPAIALLCTTLAADGDPAEARALLDGIADRLPRVVLDLLAVECETLTALDGLAAQAESAAADEDWPAAAEVYRRLLASTDRSDFRRARTLLAAAEEQAELAEWYTAALAHRRARRWEEARAVYLRIAERRESYRDTAQCLDYVDGRIAEDAEDWDAAAEAFKACGEFGGAPARAAYARGRAAAAGGDWEQAALCFAEAAPKAEEWRHYALARFAEAQADWAGAAEHFAGLELEDAARRRVLAAGHLAAAARDWREAVARFTEVPELDPPLGGARRELYAVALAAEDAGDWAAAAAGLAALPREYEAVDQRLPYCLARESEEAGAWTAAAGRYEATGHRDAADRLGYARGREAEAAGAWHEACGRYEALPPRMLDVADRLRYTRGRSADELDRWSEVIAGFGELPDSFESGEVGRRRRFARASLAAADADWDSVLAHLRGVPDGERNAAVGDLRCLARGMLAEAAGDWNAATEIYCGCADLNDPAFSARINYATLRAYEIDGNWRDLIEVGAALPPDHRDTALRLRYAAMRVAAHDEDWPEVIRLGAGIPEDFNGTPVFTGYAQLRLAAADEDWPAVVRLAADIGDHAEATVRARYAKGRIAEADEEWAKAAAAFRQCPGHADADARAAAAEGRRLEQAGHWSPAIAAYEAAGDVLADGPARLAHLRRLLEAFPWAEAITAANLAADPIALEQPAFPYAALQDAGITPASSADDAGKASFLLMRRGKWGERTRLAWDRVRFPERRLTLDAQLYWLREADGLGAALAEVDLDAADPLAALCERVPADAPLFTLLAGSRAEAVAAWRSRLVADPADMRTAHCLAVACYWLAQRLEETGAWEEAEATWRTALACWAAVINDDDFWVGWRRSRAACYGHAVTPADSSRLRARLGRHLVQVLSRTAERHSREGHPVPAARNRALIDRFESEMEAARSLKEAGGLRLEGGRNVACGPGYLEVADLREAFARFVAHAESTESHPGGGAIDGAVLRRLRWTFSELSEAFMAFERHRFEAALAALPPYYRAPRAAMPKDCAHADGAPSLPERCGSCRAFLGRNPAYAFLPQRRDRLRHDAVDLAVRVRMSIAHGLLASPGRLDEAVAELQEAIEAAGAATMKVRARQAALWMILGRADTLADSTQNTLRRLDEAIELLERSRSTVGAIGGKQVDRKLADLLVDRAVLRRAADLRADIAASLDDLRTAYRLHPDSIRIVETLSRALLTAVDRLIGRRPEERWAHLREALGLLDRGLTRFPGSLLLEAATRDVLGEVKSLNLTSLSVEALADLVAQYDEVEESPQVLYRRAVRQLETGATTESVDDLVRAVAAEPSDARYRTALLRALALLLDRHEEDE